MLTLPDCVVRNAPFHVVVGLAPTQYGVALLGRASQKQVVDTGQRGGLFVMVLGRPGEALHRPGSTAPPSALGRAPGAAASRREGSA